MLHNSYMLSIPNGWYLLRPKDMIVRYWDGVRFTNDIAPKGNGKYPSLTWRAYRKWKKFELKTQRANRRNSSARIHHYSLPEGYSSNQ